MKLINDLLKIKADINKLNDKIYKTRSKKSLERLRDQKNKLRRDFADICYEKTEKLTILIERCFDNDPKMLCVMSMVGGPYCINGNTGVHVYKQTFGGFQVIFDCYVGLLSLLEDRCGVDNLKIISDFLALERR